MTKSIYLDPNKTAELEPSEGDEKNGFWISPFEVPISLQLSAESSVHGIRSIRFEYAGGETGNPWSSLDDSECPPVLIRRGRHTGKVLEMTFALPIDVEHLSGIAERLKLAATRTSVLATRFNYLMIAAIFKNWTAVAEPAD